MFFSDARDSFVYVVYSNGQVRALFHEENEKRLQVCGFLVRTCESRTDVRLFYFPKLTCQLTHWLSASLFHLLTFQIPPPKIVPSVDPLENLTRWGPVLVAIMALLVALLK